MNVPETVFGAYYYPHVDHDSGRDARARTLGHPPPPTDIELANRAQGYFYPRRYCLSPDGSYTDFRSDNPHDVRKELELMRSAGIGAVLVDAYAGMMNGKPYSELQAPLNTIAEQIRHVDDLSFCTAMCLRLPKAVLPVKDPSLVEPNRVFDPSVETLQTLVDYSANYWNNPKYLRIGNRPVVMVYGFTSDILKRFTQQLYRLPGMHQLEGAPDERMRTIVPWMKAGTERKYGTEPLLVGIADVPLAAPTLMHLGFDWVTTMCGLTDPSSHNRKPLSIREILPPPPINERFERLLDARTNEWQYLSEALLGSMFVPSITLGWNPRGRAANPQSISLRGYPYSPVIEDLKPYQIEKMFESVRIYLSSIAFTLQKILVPIFAWNEVSLGASMLPEVRQDPRREDNETYVDTSVLRTVQQCIARFSQ